MSLVAILENGREDFLDALRGISAEAAAARPSAGQWSVIECIEHVVAAEQRYLEWITGGTRQAPARDLEKETRLFSLIRSRLTKAEAPEVFRPRGRFQTLAEAVTAFGTVRDRGIHVSRESGDQLYAIAATHPYFGAVNGGELVYLMDGHARRHADQIREIHESLAKPVPARNRGRVHTRKPFAFKRDKPDLPAVLEPAEAMDLANLLANIEGKRLRDCDFKNASVRSVHLEGCVLERVHLAGGTFGSLVWKDVILEGCDLANIRAHRIEMVRVEMVDCRLTGFHAGALDWQDVLLHNGDARYAQYQGGRFRNCEFEGCDWREADLQGADLSGARFRSCNLTAADLRHANLKDADFRQSEIDGMIVEAGDVKGAIVAPAQAMVLARLLGLRIV